MSCLSQIQRFRVSRNRQWQLAKKAARMEGVPYVLFRRGSGEWSFCRADEKYTGTETEIILP